VFATGNFDLTVRRAARSLKDSDCWLLVCDSRGINVLCSSLAGHFGTQDVVRAIESMRLETVVSHSRIVLPQLCAGNMSLEGIRDRTGFAARFGPVSIKDALSFSRGTTSVSSRSVTFDAAHRLEMAVGCPILLSALLVLVFNFFGFEPLLYVLPFLYFYSAVHGLLFKSPPIRKTGVWAAAVGAVVLGAQLLLALGTGLGTPLTAIVTAAGMAYLVTEFSGWSPLVKYSLMPHSRKRIELNSDLCIACGRCRTVCPKAVFESAPGKAAITASAECILCRACVFQCPADALALVEAS
jgi:NAD-dependent dihydropyrimidine dehydrogenase PreA subunit